MCDFKCSKYLLFFFNFLFWILGLAIMGVGIWALVDKNFISNLGGAFPNAEAPPDLASVVQMSAVALLVLGGIIMVIGFFGCCGAITENQCCLGIFFVLLLLCFIATVAIGGIFLYIALSENEMLQERTEDMISKLWENLGEKDKENFEKTYSCCGSGKVIDFTSTSFRTCAGLDLKKIKEQNWNVGCFDKLMHELRVNVVIAGSIMLGIALIELLGMSMACVVCCGIKRAYAAV